MDVALVLSLVKDRLGIRTVVRDPYLNAIIESIITELEDEKGITLQSNFYHMMFVVDYATWRYQSRDSTKAMPRHLQYRLHNLMLHAGGGKS